jgi:glutaredoxin-like YruB-family protein
MSVILYTTPTCGFCHQVKAYLNGRGVPFTEHDVSRDRTAAMRMVQLTGQQGVPVVVIDGQAVIGFNRPRIDQLLAQMGAQKPRLGAAIANAGRIAARRGLDLPKGAYVGKVEGDSPATRAGLEVGDVIVGMANHDVGSDQDVDQIMSQLHAGQSAPVRVWRDGRTLELYVSF